MSKPGSSPSKTVPCSYPGCKNKTTNSEGLCYAHRSGVRTKVKAPANSTKPKRAPSTPGVPPMIAPPQPPAPHPAPVLLPPPPLLEATPTPPPTGRFTTQQVRVKRLAPGMALKGEELQVVEQIGYGVYRLITVHGRVIVLPSHHLVDVTVPIPVEAERSEG